MDSSSRSEWHAGGTRLPFVRERGGSRSEIRNHRATDFVPYRATGSITDQDESLVKSEVSISLMRCGTKWHGRPHVSARGRWRA